MNPLYSETAYPDEDHRSSQTVRSKFIGLTKLEAFTMAAMQSLIPNMPIDTPKASIVMPIFSAKAVEIAKSTLDALAKEQGVKIE